MRLLPHKESDMGDRDHPYRDLNDPGNHPRHRVGKPCIERGCTEPAGTAWSPHWCVGHNIERMDRIGRNLEETMRRFDPPPS